MIHLSNNKYIDVEEWYLDFMYPLIKNSPTTMGKMRAWFYSCGMDCRSIDDLNFWRVVLINPFSSESKSNFPVLNEYYQICELMQRNIQYIKLSYKHAKQNGYDKSDRQFYKEERERVLNNYFEGTFIESMVSMNKEDYQKNNTNYNELFSELKKKLKKLNDILSEIINYDLLAKLDNKRTELILKLNINVCPYCNRQYISGYSKDKQSTLAHLDHFIPKEHFLLYSLSLYNFIPSCVACNTMLKVTANLPIDKLISDKGNKEPIFYFIHHDISSLLGLNKNLEIKVNTDIDNKNNFFMNEQFALESQYEFHKTEVQYFRKRSILKYSKYYKEGLKQVLNEPDDNEIDTVIMGYAPDLSNIYNQTLSKLHYDLYHSNPILEPE